MIVSELIALLQKMPQHKLVELEAGGDWTYADPHTVREKGDVVEIISKPEADDEGE